MEAQAQRAEFWTDLASAARALVSQPSVPLVSVAVMLFPGVLVLTPLHHSVALSVIDFAGAIFLLGWYGAERVFFLRHLEGKPVTLRHLLELVKPFMGRFFAVGLLFGIVMLIPMRVVAAFGLHRPHGAPLSASFWVSFGVVLVIMDFALTFVTPALAYTTRSAVRALRIGFGMIRQTWPRCALYVLCPPLALNILHVLHPVSHLGMQLALSAALAFVGLVAKGAIAAFYLRERGSYSDDGAAYITAQDEPHEERRVGDLMELMRSSSVEVGAAKALLEAHGVTAHLFDAHGSAVLGSLPGVNVRLLVPRSDIERSLETLRSTPESGSGEEFA